MNETREHILKTSLLLFLRKSYREVTMNEIVRKTGLSKGAFYHYFKSKEELFREIVNLFFDLGSLDYGSFPTGSLKAFYHTYLEKMEASFHKIDQLTRENDEKKGSLNVFLILFDAVSRFPEFLEIELKQYHYELEQWEKAVAAARESGEIRTESDDRQIARLFLYCTDGVFIRYVNSREKSSYREQLGEAFDSIYLQLKN